MKNYDSNYKFVDSIEDFIKESIDNGKKNIVIQQTHDFGQIQLEFAPKTMLISGTVYSFSDDETEKCYQLQVKDLAYEDAQSHAEGRRSRKRDRLHPQPEIGVTGTVCLCGRACRPLP